MLRKPATTTPQFHTTWRFGKDWQHAAVHLQKDCFLLKLRHFSQKGSLQQSHFRGRKQIGFLDSKKWSSPVQHVDVCVIFPAFCGFIVSAELLKQLGAFRASYRNPKNRVATRSNAWIWRARFWSRLIEMKKKHLALSKAKSGGAWQSHFWQCGTLRPARNTKLFALRK